MTEDEVDQLYAEASEEIYAASQQIFDKLKSKGLDDDLATSWVREILEDAISCYE